MLKGISQLRVFMSLAPAHGNENNCTNGSQLRGRPFEGKNVVVIQYLLALNTALALLNHGKQQSGRIKRRDKPFLTLIGNF